MIKQDILDYAAKNFVTDDPKKQAQYNDVREYLTTRKVVSLYGWNNRHSVETYALFDGAKKAPDVGVYLTKLKRDDAAAAVKSEQANKEQARLLVEEKQRELRRAELRKRDEERRKNEEETYARRKAELADVARQASGGQTGPLFGNVIQSECVRALGHARHRLPRSKPTRPFLSGPFFICVCGCRTRGTERTAPSG
jgi:ribosomal protein L9